VVRLSNSVFRSTAFDQRSGSGPAQPADLRTEGDDQNSVRIATAMVHAP
jgi:hypothetical protein